MCLPRLKPSEFPHTITALYAGRAGMESMMVPKDGGRRTRSGAPLELETITKDSPRWGALFRQHVQELQMEISSITAELCRLDEKLANWKM